jgi:UDP-GlcNAc:undecaprenyl-phosphate GlcNAc-1-phosphate transferase
VLALYVLSAFLGLCAMVLVESGVWKAMLLILAVSIFVITGVKFMGDSGEDDSINVDQSKDK